MCYENYKVIFRSTLTSPKLQKALTKEATVGLCSTRNFNRPNPIINMTLYLVVIIE